MVKYVKGDLFKAPVDIIAHGCNCIGGFGSGVAGQMAKKYPIVKEYYQHVHETKGWVLGDVQFVALPANYDPKDYLLFVANCATQQAYFPRNVVHADYPAIRTCMEKVKEFAIKNDLSIAIPKIGAGLAGGDWNTIEAIVSDVFSDYNILVCTLE